MIISDVVGRLELAVYTRVYFLCSIEVVDKFLTDDFFFCLIWMLQLRILHGTSC